MLREKAIAHAYHLREQARGIPVRGRPGDNERRNAYTKVAEAFLASAQEATIFRERSEYYRIAAEAFLVLEDHAQAAKAFEKASKFTEAAQHYRHAGLFDEMVSVIKNHGDAIDPTVRTSLLMSRDIFIFNEEMMEISSYFLSPVFTLTASYAVLQESIVSVSNAEEQLEFARDCDLDIAEVNILVGRGQFFEAADLHIRKTECSTPLKSCSKIRPQRKQCYGHPRACLTLFGMFSPSAYYQLS